MNFSTESPFAGPAPLTVPLPSTPLASALVQVKFPEVLSIAKLEYVADFQEEIRSSYPLNQQDQSILLRVTPDEVKQTKAPNWRFFDAERHWRASLATGFLTLETRNYTNREEFTRRIAYLALALSKTIAPTLMTRIGVRYVDRVHGAFLDRLEEFVRPELLGCYIPAHKENISSMFSEMSADTNAGAMTSRWGFMPKRQTHDLELMPPIENTSWFLDVDTYQEFSEPIEFNSSDIGERVKELAACAYRFFRWAVSDEFLKACGGKL